MTRAVIRYRAKIKLIRCSGCQRNRYVDLMKDVRRTYRIKREPEEK